ncbi:MAG: glycosyltransferase family 1 protein, partial [Cyanobacteria bacterium P01_F01_bin.153]
MKQRSPHSKSTPAPLNRPKKISILVSDFSQKSVGRWGGSVRTFILAEALENLGYDIELVGANFGEDYPALEAMGQRWSLKIVPGTRYPNFFKSAWQISNYIDGDIVYAHKLKPSSFGI